MKKLLYISVNSKPEELSASKTVARKFINKFLQYILLHELQIFQQFKHNNVLHDSKPHVLKVSMLHLLHESHNVFDIPHWLQNLIQVKQIGFLHMKHLNKQE